MKAIANFFLRAKHWQIFVLLCVVPTIADFAAIGVMPTRIRSWHDFGPGALLFIGVIALYLVCSLAYFGSMGLFFDSLVKPELRMQTQFFRFSLVYAVAYAFIFFLVVTPDTGFPGWLVPLHLACMVCLFYLLYFVSKNLVLAETKKPVSFYEYAGPLFLLWFFPVGVWFIQPRINRLFEERSGAEAFPKR